MVTDQDLYVLCPTDLPDAPALCAALQAALSARLAEAAIDLNLHATTTALPEDHPGVRLYLVKSDTVAASLTARLEWRTAHGTLQRGPELSLDVMDAPLSAVHYTSLVRSLLTLSPELTETIGAQP
jgi:hypothetical protein